MNEDTWFNTNNVDRMLLFVKPSARKGRLFSVACCRGCLLNSPAILEVLNKIEQFADEEIDFQEFQKITARADDNTWLRNMIVSKSRLEADARVQAVYWSIFNHPGLATSALRGQPGGRLMRQALAKENNRQADILRAMYKPYTKIEIEPSRSTQQVALALYHGDNVVNFLCDSLLDDGCDDFANMYIRNKHYKTFFKGCWVLDRILDRC